MVATEWTHILYLFCKSTQNYLETILYTYVLRELSWSYGQVALIESSCVTGWIKTSGLNIKVSTQGNERLVYFTEAPLIDEEGRVL